MLGRRWPDSSGEQWQAACWGAPSAPVQQAGTWLSRQHSGKEEQVLVDSRALRGCALLTSSGPPPLSLGISLPVFAQEWHKLT